MADKLLSGVSVIPEYVDGEQPSAAKFTSLGSQVRRGLTQLEKAVGDIWDQNWPYTDVTPTWLSQAFAYSPFTGLSVTGANSQGRRLDLASLARLIGPSSNLNPAVLTGTVIISGEALTSGVTETTTRYVPDLSVAVSINQLSGTVFTTKVATPELISSAGQWAITETGEIYTYSPIVAGTTINYTTNSDEWGGGSAYPNATFNVIPDPNQIAVGSSEPLAITGPDANSLYTIQLPKVTHQGYNSALTAATLIPGSDFNYKVQLTLPKILTDNFSTGDVIPGGFIYLRNNTTNTIYLDGIYIYNDIDTMQVSGIDLGSGYTSDEFSLVTIGTDITSSIAYLQQRAFAHSHNRTFGEKPIDISSVAGILAYPGVSGAFVPSEQPGNWMPQYLHRDGWRTGIDDANANDHNAMRGHLLIGLEAGTPGNYESAAGGTFYLAFGDDPTDRIKSPAIYRSKTNDLTIEGQNALGDDIDIRSYNNLRLTASNDTGSDISYWYVNYQTGLRGFTSDGDIVLQADNGAMTSQCTENMIFTSITGEMQFGVFWQSGAASGRWKFYDTLYGDFGATNAAWSCQVAKSSGSIAEFKNTSGNSSADILVLEFSAKLNPSYTNHFLKFNDSAGTRGFIAGSDTATDEAFWNEDTNVGAGVNTATAAGNVRYVTGAADYGEWLPIGDIDEWGMPSVENHEEYIRTHRRFGLSEGAVVYVREGKIFKFGPGTPMIITCRAAVIGNASELMNENLAYGEVVSFIGQVPVLTKGVVHDGDLLIPDGDMCIAVSSEKCTFEQYKAAIGTAWETNNDISVKRVLCAIRVK